MNIPLNAIIHKKINDRNISFYNEHGYLVADGLFNKEEIAEIKHEALEIFKGNRGKIDGLVDVNATATEYDLLKHYIAIHFPH